MADLNWLAWMVVWNMASKAPEIPAKKELMIKASRLWWARLIPMASAATSSSRIALKAPEQIFCCHKRLMQEPDCACIVELNDVVVKPLAKNDENTH